MPRSAGQLVKPAALHPGDAVGIVAPASNLKREELEAGCAALRRAGYKPVYLDSILDRDLYFAGTAERRARELEKMFLDEDIRAIVCARGGYGANHLLNRLDFEKINNDPKIFVGYSDVSCLLTQFVDRCGFVTFHGPMVAKDWAHDNGVDLNSWRSALTSTLPWDISTNEGAAGLVEGEAEGTLYGGCLSILVSSLGTPYEIETDQTILFLEDVAAKPYQIDRMLMQLKLGGHLKNVRGIIFGEMMDCAQSATQDYTLPDVILRVVGDLQVPVAYGVKSGHVSSGNITLPFGVEASLSVRKGVVSLRMLESAISL